MVDEPTRGAPPPNPRRLLAHKRLLIAVAALVLLPVALLVTAIVVAQSEWAERWIEARVGERIGREVQVEDIDLDLAWPPVVNLARLRIGNPPWCRRGSG